MQLKIRYFIGAIMVALLVSACGFRAKQFTDGGPVGGGGGPPPGTGTTTGGSTGSTTGSTGCATNNLVVAWDTSVDASGNPDQSILGHVVYTGPSTRSYDRTYTQSVTPPIVNTYQYGVTALGLGTYYLTVTAYNSDGESAYSNEVACNFTACDTPCIVVAQMQTSQNLQKLAPPSAKLFTIEELEKAKPQIFAQVKKQIEDSKKSEAFRSKLKDDLPPGNLTINTEDFKKDWEQENEKQ